MKPPLKNLLLAISSLGDPAPLLNLIFYLLDVKNQFTEPKYCKADPGDFLPIFPSSVKLYFHLRPLILPKANSLSLFRLDNH